MEIVSIIIIFAWLILLTIHVDILSKREVADGAARRLLNQLAKKSGYEAEFWEIFPSRIVLRSEENLPANKIEFNKLLEHLGLEFIEEGRKLVKKK
jgi:hypothetical protein